MRKFQTVFGSMVTAALLFPSLSFAQSNTTAGVSEPPQTSGVNIIAQAALDAGFTPSQAVIATAIAGAESSYNTNNYGYNPYTYVSFGGAQTIGAWQIDLQSWGSVIASLGGGTTPAQQGAWLLNPYNNAKLAYIVSNGGTNWTPWCSYSGGNQCGAVGYNGTYAQYLGQAQTAVNTVLAGGSGATATSSSTRVTPQVVQIGTIVPTTYTVQPGDSLFLIAQRYGVTLESLINANPQISDPNLIFPNQTIQLP